MNSFSFYTFLFFNLDKINILYWIWAWRELSVIKKQMTTYMALKLCL